MIYSNAFFNVGEQRTRFSLTPAILVLFYFFFIFLIDAVVADAKRLEFGAEDGVRRCGVGVVRVRPGVVGGNCHWILLLHPLPAL